MTEDKFHQDWLDIYQDLSQKKPLDLDKLVSNTAKLSSEPGHLFSAGYQAAIRKTFPQIDCAGWLSFAVSEDKQVELRPPVTIRDNKLYGYKSWIAGAAHVQQLVVKVGRGPDVCYLLADSHANQVTLDLKAEPGFLPTLSQAQAHFDGAEFQTLDASLVKLFAVNEPYYIYRAFLTYLSEHFEGLKDQADGALKTCSASELAALDTTVQSLLMTMQKDKVELGQHWANDRRLFQMYSQGIQSRN